MTHPTFHRLLRVAIVSILGSAAWPAPAFAQATKRILLVTDAEGVNGVCSWNQTDSKNPEMRQLLTGEINAAVEGFLDAGADEVTVFDGHANGENLSPLTIHPKARLALGAPFKMMLESKFAGMAFVGQHSMAQTRRGNLAHTYAHELQSVLVNGKPIGEIGARAAVAGAYQVPVIMLSGDRAAAAELQAIVPQAEVAVVKEGLGRTSCIGMSARAAQDLIRAAAAKAMRKIGTIPPYTIPGPVTVIMEFTARDSLTADLPPNASAEVLDSHTVRYQGRNFVEAWQKTSLD